MPQAIASDLSNRPAAWTLVVWFALAVGVGASGVFSTATPPLVAITVWGLVALVFLAMWTLPFAKSFAYSVSVRALVAVHLIRFVGIAFIVLYTRGLFPFSFGLLGGAGDTAVAIGAVAILSFCKPASSWAGWILAWNLLGLVDIVAVVVDALREGLHDSAMMAPLRQFPLSLLPTFFVPLIIVSHVLIFARRGKISAA